MEPAELLQEIAIETIAQLDNALGDDFEAVVIVFPSKKLIDETTGDLPCSMHSTADPEHTKLAITGLYKEDKPLIVLANSVH